MSVAQVLLYLIMKFVRSYVSFFFLFLMTIQIKYPEIYVLIIFLLLSAKNRQNQYILAVLKNKGQED